jgi:hypothetical protein
MKRFVVIFLTIFFITASLSFSPGMEGAQEKNQQTEDTSGSGTNIALVCARELGLLCAGIVWEAVRIVLPTSCPQKEMDIDQLLSTGCD